VSEHRVTTVTPEDNDAGDSRQAHGGDRSTAEGGHLEDLTRAELYQQAREAEVHGRSDMSKHELIEALSENDKPIAGRPS
jgi:hypothetical protein